VQRVSDVGSRREFAQDVFRLSALLGAVGLDAALTKVRDSQLLLHAIRRQPLVVGFTDRHQIFEKKIGDMVSTAKTRAELGWLLGPALKLVKDGTSKFGGTFVQFGFRQLNKQNSLAATIAVPSWWPSVTLKAAGCWRRSVGGGKDSCDDISLVIAKAIDWDAKRAADGEVFKASVKTIPVDMPVDVAELDRILVTGRSLGPDPQFASVRDDMEIGRPGRILIPGNNLWRNGVVTVGTQASDRVIVLPNMKGIIAEFSTVLAPAGWRTGDGPVSRPIRVWTSEGQTLAGFAKLHGVAPASGRVVAVNGIHVIREPLVLDVTPGLIPESHHSLNVALRNFASGGVGNWKFIDNPEIDRLNGRVAVTTTTTDLCAQCESGTLVEAAFVVRQRADIPQIFYKASNLFVLYEDAASSKAQLLSGINGDPGTPAGIKVADLNAGVDLFLLLPANAKRAYEGFAAEGAPVSVKLGGKDVAATVISASIGNRDCLRRGAGAKHFGRLVCKMTVKTSDEAALNALIGAGKKADATFGFNLAKGKAPIITEQLEISAP
jgi:hypothetical protein